MSKIKRFKEFIKKTIDPRASHMSWGMQDVEHEEDKPDRSKHLSWSMKDVEHHEKEIKEDQHYLDLDKAGNKDYWKNPNGGLKSPLSAHEKDAAHKTMRAQVKAYEPPKQSDENQHNMDLPGGKGHSFTHAVEREHNYLDQFKHDHEHVAAQHMPRAETFSHEQKTAIRYYKGDSEPFNKHLRDTQGKETVSPKYHELYGHDPEGQHPRTGHIDAVTNNPIPHDMHLFRGMHDAAFKKLSPGHKFTDHGFTGTSLDPNVAASFGHNNAIFHIHAPAGTKGHYLNADPKAGLEHEKELLLHRGTKFEITGHSKIPPHPSDRYAVPMHVTHLKIIDQQDHHGD